MRSESEVRAMIAELRAIEVSQIKASNGRSPPGLMSIIAALENVLEGPAEPQPCGCIGPGGYCPCLVRGMIPKPAPGTTPQWDIPMSDEEESWGRFEEITRLARNVVSECFDRERCDQLVAGLDHLEVCALMNALHDHIGLRLWSAKRRGDTAAAQSKEAAP